MGSQVPAGQRYCYDGVGAELSSCSHHQLCLLGRVCTSETEKPPAGGGGGITAV